MNYASVIHLHECKYLIIINHADRRREMLCGSMKEGGPGHLASPLFVSLTLALLLSVFFFHI